MADKNTKPRLGRGLSSLLQTTVKVDVGTSNITVPAVVPGPVVAAAVSGPATAPKAAAMNPAGAPQSRGGGIAPAAPVASVAKPAAPALKARPAAPGSPAPAASTAVGGLHSLALDSIVVGRFQPRREIDVASLEGLTASIRSSGVMQPIAVRPLSGDDSRSALGASWEIVAGERRWRAAKLAGLQHVPAVISDLSDREAAEWGLVENLQREDLNPMDRAWGLRNLVEGFNLAHAEAATRVGLDRSSVSNLVRLTELEAPIQELLRTGSLGLGHGKALLAHPAGPGREKLAKLAASQGWSVRRLERAAGVNPGTPSESGGIVRSGDATKADAAIRDLERQLSDHLGTKVRVMTGGSRSRGRIVIDFYSLEHFDGLTAMMGFKMQG